MRKESREMRRRGEEGLGETNKPLLHIQANLSTESSVTSLDSREVLSLVLVLVITHSHTLHTYPHILTH